MWLNLVEFGSWRVALTLLFSCILTTAGRRHRILPVSCLALPYPAHFTLIPSVAIQSRSLLLLLPYCCFFLCTSLTSHFLLIRRPPTL